MGNIATDHLSRNGQTTFYDDELGCVIVHIKPQARRFICRWTKGNVHLTVPPHATTAQINQAWTTLRPRMIANRPTLDFKPGTVIQLDGLSIEIDRQTLEPNTAIIHSELPTARISIGSDFDNKPDVRRDIIDRALKRIAYNVAPRLLLPRAKQLAAQCGCSPAGWSITYGTKTLGYCTPTKKISLSSNIVFLTQELRDYIVYHELAHLSEMNHSQRFHQLCNAYCQGREAALIAALRRHPWPILR